MHSVELKVKRRRFIKYTEPCVALLACVAPKETRVALWAEALTNQDVFTNWTPHLLATSTWASDLAPPAIDRIPSAHPYSSFSDPFPFSTFFFSSSLFVISDTFTSNSFPSDWSASTTPFQTARSRQTCRIASGVPMTGQRLVRTWDE